jgi:hypothetical protein
MFTIINTKEPKRNANNYAQVLSEETKSRIEMIV